MCRVCVMCIHIRYCHGMLLAPLIICSFKYVYICLYVSCMCNVHIHQILSRRCPCAPYHLLVQLCLYMFIYVDMIYVSCMCYAYVHQILSRGSPRAPYHLLVQTFSYNICLYIRTYILLYYRVALAPLITCLFRHFHICVYGYMYICAYGYMYICVFMYIYIYTRKQR